MDIRILHRSGRHNANADALSRFPIPGSGATSGVPEYSIISALTAELSDVTPPEKDLPGQQREDEELAAIITYLETGILPEDEKVAKALVLSQSQYCIEDGILYHVEADSTLRLVPPVTHREKLFQQAHGGPFGGHLSDVKVHSELRRHYWWPSMRSDISRWTRGCLVCATYSTGRATHAPLTPIPVAGPFDRVGVDVIKFPQSHDGNMYAIVFMDYLTKWPEVFAVADQSAATVAKLLALI